MLNAALLLTVAAWPASYHSNAGAGVALPGGSPWDPDVIAEISLVRGGLHVALADSRVNGSVYDEPPTSTTTVGGTVYVIDVRPVRGSTIWWPSFIREPGVASVVLLVPFWIIIPALAIASRGLRFRALRSMCEYCRYSREGLNPGAACPECGMGLLEPSNIARISSAVQVASSSPASPQEKHQ